MIEELLYDSVLDTPAKTIIYNEDKTKSFYLEDLDLNNGRIEIRKEIIHHDAVEAIEEISHYEVVAEYPNGGKDLEKVIDQYGQEGKDAYDEEIEYQVYIPYSENEIRLIQIKEELILYKQSLLDTDYKAIKYAEGWYTEEDYAPIKEERENWRIKVRELQQEQSLLMDLIN